MSTNNTEGSVQPKIVRGQVDSLSIFEITDYELELLEQGSPNSIFLNFAVFFISIATSFFITLLTVDISSVKLFSVFVILTVIGFFAGLLLLVLWYRTRSKIRNLIKRIKARVPLNVASDVPIQSTPISGPTESSS